MSSEFEALAARWRVAREQAASGAAPAAETARNSRPVPQHRELQDREVVTTPEPRAPRALPTALASTHYGAPGGPSLCTRAWVSEFGSKGTLDPAAVTCPRCLRKLPAQAAPPAPQPSVPEAAPTAPTAEPPPAPVELPPVVVGVRPVPTPQRPEEPSPPPAAAKRPKRAAKPTRPQINEAPPPAPPAPSSAAPAPTERDLGPDEDASAALEALVLDTPEADPSDWDPAEEEAADVTPDDGADEEEPAKLPDDLPVKVSDAAQRVLNARTLDARERERMAAGFYIAAPGEAEAEDDPDQEGGYGEEADEGEPELVEDEADALAGEADPSVVFEPEDLIALNRAEVDEAGASHSFERPLTRGDCQEGERPCPWVGCKWHLYLEVLPGGRLKVNHPRVDVLDMTQTCTLDIADKGDATLEVIGRAMNVTRERIRQLEAKAQRRIRGSVSRREALQQYADGGAMVVKRVRLPVLEEAPRPKLLRGPTPKPPAPAAATPAPLPPPPVPVELPVAAPPPPQPPVAAAPPRAPRPPRGSPPPRVAVEVTARPPLPRPDPYLPEAPKPMLPPKLTWVPGARPVSQIVGPTVIVDVITMQASVRRMHPSAARTDRLTESGLLELTAHQRTVLYWLHNAMLSVDDVALKFNVSLTFVRKLEERALEQLGVRL